VQLSEKDTQNGFPDHLLVGRQGELHFAFLLAYASATFQACWKCKQIWCYLKEKFWFQCCVGLFRSAVCGKIKKGNLVAGMLPLVCGMDLGSVVSKMVLYHCV